MAHTQKDCRLACHLEVIRDHLEVPSSILRVQYPPPYFWTFIVDGKPTSGSNGCYMSTVSDFE
jgi:hypothetical protein